MTETIRATSDEAWAVVEDVARYPDWDSGVERVEGRLAPGEKLKVYSEATPAARSRSRSRSSRPAGR